MHTLILASTIIVTTAAVLTGLSIIARKVVNGWRGMVAFFHRADEAFDTVRSIPGRLEILERRVKTLEHAPTALAVDQVFALKDEIAALKDAQRRENTRRSKDHRENTARLNAIEVSLHEITERVA